jgi:Holliday junction DNA helicase RuvA
MINYLKGIPIGLIKNANNRYILIIEVNSLGYEVQIPSRLARELSLNSPIDNPELIQIFTHLQIREDHPMLYGFGTAAERDLFRQLISVTGIGSQLGITLIDTLGLESLIRGIVTQNINLLCKTPGVGKKTAERITLELKTELAQWRQIERDTTSTTSTIPSATIVEELETTLSALGYTDEEIKQALSAITQDNQLLKNPNVEEWLRKAISWLSFEN